MRKMKVTVRKSDITQGHPRAVNSCPIANAIKRRAGVLPRSVAVASARNIQFRLRGKRYRMTGPHKVDRFIDRFDEDKTGKPFAFVGRLVPIPEA